MLKYIKQAAGGLLVTGLIVGRAYQYLFDQETRNLRSSRNLEFSTALNRFQFMRNQPEQAELMPMLIPAASIIGSAYTLYCRRNGTPNIAVFPRVWPSHGEVSQEVQVQTTFGSRLDAIHVKDEEIPERFIDPITCYVMENPVKAVTIIRNSSNEPIRTVHYYDKATFDSLNGICPINRQPFVEMQEDPALKEDIKAFVEEQEALASENVMRVR